MQKILHYLVILVALVGMTTSAVPASAAAEPTVSKEEAAVLKQTLDVLTVLLAQMKIQLADPENLKQAAIYSAALGQIGEKLSMIGTALGPAPVVVRAPEAPKAEAKPAPPPVAITKPAEPEAEEVEEEAVAALEAPGPTGLIGSLEETGDEEKAAAVGSTFGGGAWLWVIIGAVVIGAILFWPRGKEEMKVEPVRESEPHSASVEIKQESF